MAKPLRIELAAALPDRQFVLTVEVPAGATVADALKQVDLARQFPDFPVDLERVGIFGKRCRLDQVLVDGDRIELYRPLSADPKEVRRELAALERKNRGAG